jgi:putative membrane protein
LEVGSEWHNYFAVGGKTQIMKKLLVIFLASSIIACNDSNDTDKDNKADSYASNTEDQAKKANKENAAASDEDAQFLMKAANGGMMEVELGRMAQSNAANQQVKDFGNRMVTDHTKANEELKALAASRNVTLPAMAEGKHRDHMTELGKKIGNEFDRAYMDLMVSDHSEDVSMFEKAANNSKDAGIKAFAAKTLPVLKAHHEAAKNLHQQLQQLRK